MDEITSAALEELSATIADLLPPPPETNLPHTVQVYPVRVTPSGVGGYVGLRSSPSGELSGRRISARVAVSIQTHDAAALGSAVAGVTGAVASRDAAHSRSAGLLRLEVARIGSAMEVAGGGVHRQEVEFSALFEHLHAPADGSGVIEQVPILTEVASTSSGGQVLYRSSFGAGALDGFESIDDPGITAGGPSRWEHDPEAGRIRQLSPLQGGASGAGISKPGGYLLLRPPVQGRLLSDFVLTSEVTFSDQAEVGLVFRWQDVDDFHFVLLGSALGTGLLGRKFAGAFTVLDSLRRGRPTTHQPGRSYSVRVTARADLIQLHIDGQLTLEGRAHDSRLPGRVGLFSRASGSTEFHRLDLIAL